MESKNEKESVAGDESDTKSESNIADMDLKSRDVFKGMSLIDRLLVYYSKFEGSREKASRYAQKLLDLGHIESITHSDKFEDSSHVYRWTDVASVVNRAKAKAGGFDHGNLEALTNKSSSEETISSSMIENREKKPKPTVRISIEAENCDEIQAHIRTSPQGKGTVSSIVSSSNNSGTFDRSNKGSRIVSFVKETSKTEEVLRLVPISQPTNESIKEEKNEENEKPRANVKSSQSSTDEILSPRKKVTMMMSEYPQNKLAENSLTSKHDESSEWEKVNEERRGNQIKMSNSKVGSKETLGHSTPTIVLTVTPGPGESSITTSSASKSLNADDEREKNSILKDEERLNTPSKYRWKEENVNGRLDTPSSVKYERVSVAANSLRGSTSTPPRPHPRGSSPASKSKSSPVSIGLKNIDSENLKGSQQEKTPKKIKIKNDEDWIRLRNEYIEHEDLREITQTSKQQNDNAAITLHSSSVQNGYEHTNAGKDECVESGGGIIIEGNYDEYSRTQKKETIECPEPPPIVSPDLSPISSPTPPNSPAKPELVMKSLFWTKIVCTPEECQNAFWQNLDNEVEFNTEEFQVMFSKPIASPQRKRSSGKYGHEVPEDGKTVKVLSAERSRQVGIRASSIRLPVEEIHDAIINMDDTLLDVDALEALYDVRPTPEELDDIADVLKHHPNSILDKPEQFVLMLAMINNLDERLKCWILTKKFPDRALDITEQLNTLSNACIETVRNPTLHILLECILKLGNFMNKGTQRGQADGFLFDILPKLRDVKSQKADTNLLQYLVKWFTERQDELCFTSTPRKSENEGASDEDEDYGCKLPSQNLLQKASAITLQDVLENLEALSFDINECKEELIPSVIEGGMCMADVKLFNERMTEFLYQAEKAYDELRRLSDETTEITKDFKLYYIPRHEKPESLSNLLRYMETFCSDFREYWNAEKRNTIKDAYFNTKKAKWRRMTAIRITESPSTLKARFLEKRSRERGRVGRHPQYNVNSGLHPCRQQNGEAKFGSGHASTPEEQRQQEFRKREEGSGRKERSLQRFRMMKEKHQNEVTPNNKPVAFRRLVNNMEDFRSESRGSNRKLFSGSTPMRGMNTMKGNKQNELEQDERDSQLEHYLGKVRKNSEEIDQKLESLKKKQQQVHYKTNESESGVSRMKNAMMQRRLMVKSKTC